MKPALELEGFSYSKGQLHCEGVPLSEIAREVGTPVYVYSRAALVNRVNRLKAALLGSTGDRRRMNAPDVQIYFAVKSCSNVHLLSLLGKAGCGADIVSAGELFRSTVANIPSSRIVFSGVGKAEREIVEALKAEIHLFNVESVDELKTINRLAGEASTTAQVSFRVNPDVDARTHPHISTGLKQNKFGLSKSELREIYQLLPGLKHVTPVGLSCHIGSQILTLTPFRQAWNELLKAAEAAPFEVKLLDLGGGLGINYGGGKETLSLEDYGRLIHKMFSSVETPRYRIGIEPGRSLVGPAAVLLTRLIGTKKRGSRSFYIVDCAMNDLIRPALYGAVHPLLCVEKPASRKTVVADLVGPVCESSDTFQTGARLPQLSTGALLAFANAGAYAMSMASQYNSRPRAPEVLVDGTSYHLIRSRETYADLIQNELL